MAASNVELQPGDTVVVPRAGIVYILGEVTRPGGYVLNSTGGITVLQTVAVAAGLLMSLLREKRDCFVVLGMGFRSNG